MPSARRLFSIVNSKEIPVEASRPFPCRRVCLFPAGHRLWGHRKALFYHCRNRADDIANRLDFFNLLVFDLNVEFFFHAMTSSTMSSESAPRSSSLVSIVMDPFSIDNCSQSSILTFSKIIPSTPQNEICIYNKNNSQQIFLCQGPPLKILAGRGVGIDR